MSNNIQDLCVEDFDHVNGGLPMLVGVAIALYGGAAVKAAVASVAAAAGAAVILAAAHDD